MAITMDFEAVARVQASLARAYTAVGRLILDVPTAELFSSAKSELLAVRVDTASVLPDTAKEIQALCESMSHPLADIRLDYAQLFAGVKKLPAPPWESCYLSGKRQVCTEVTEAVRLAYLEACFCQDAGEAQPDDHIGLELQFVGNLYQCLAALDPATDEAREIDILRQGFVSDHLNRWALDFCGDLEQAAETEFYRSLAQVIRRFVEMQMGDAPCSD